MRGSGCFVLILTTLIFLVLFYATAVGLPLLKLIEGAL